MKIFLYQALGMPQEAIACYQHALQTRPNYAMAYGELAALYQSPASCISFSNTHA